MPDLCRGLVPGPVLARLVMYYGLVFKPRADAVDDKALWRPW